MVKHNKAVDCNQSRKDLHPLYKTWLNQPARKQRRRQARQAKAAASPLAPINCLRPFVNCPSQKYNWRVRAGRGFTLEEIAAVGLNKHSARSVKIAVDERRVNSNKEAFERNVNRLKEFLANIVIVSNKKVAGKAHAGLPAAVAATQVAGKQRVIRISNKPVQDRKVLVSA